MKLTLPAFFLLSSLIVSIAGCDRKSEVESPWPEINQTTKPWSRWWWMGSEVDKANITSLMKQYTDAGLGGLEITPLYGVQGHEDRTLEFLSGEWMDMLDFCITESGKQGMGLDMNLGTGWPFGGPQITAWNAASKLILRTYHLSEGEILADSIQPEQHRDRGEGVFLEALMAYGGDGTILDLTSHVADDGTLDWIPDSGSWTLYAAFSGRTRQLVKRAAPGGEGFTMDHFSPTALDTYLDRFNSAFEGRKSVRAFFNDSYEVYNASWTPGLFAEFLQRRGYDLRDHLDVLTGGADRERTARIKSDYRQTLGELLLENFTVPWTSWSNQHGALTRNQAHGSPGNLIDLYATVDIPECEIFGHRTFQIPGLRVNNDDTRNVEPNPMMLKLATSAAHVTNKSYISNETFTWLGEHFKVALSQCKPEVEEAFLAGINHVFYHGTTYSPGEAAWPGWLFYASVHFGPTNSFWPHLIAMNKYITRCQSLLQSGKPDNEVLVYWPVYDIWDNPDGLEMQLSVHNIQEWLVYPGIDRMAGEGYSYDFISDALLQEVGTRERILHTADGEVTYQVLVVPACRKMPLGTLQKILDLAFQGGTVVFESLPEDVPGYNSFEERKDSLDMLLGSLEFEDAGQGIMKCRTGEGAVLKCSDLGKALSYEGIGREFISDLGLKFTRRTVEDGRIYYLVNHGLEAFDGMVPINTPAASVLIMDPQDESWGNAQMETGGRRTRVRVQLKPGQSLFLRVFRDTPYEAAGWAYEKERLEPIPLEGKWDLAFQKGGPTLPASRIMEELKPWTSLEDQDLIDFSGTGVYTHTFHMPELTADRYLLDLGDLYESARIRLNDKDLGVIWSLPHEISTGGFLEEGENTLVIEVANLMSNRIRYLDRNGISWRNFKEINFVNIAYEPFDASQWETEPSGLLGPVRIIPVNTYK